MIGNQQKERFGKRGELLKGLTGGQIAKVKAYKSQEKMLAFAKGGCIELTNDQLEAISGGGCDFSPYEEDQNCQKWGHCELENSGGLRF